MSNCLGNVLKNTGHTLKKYELTETSKMWVYHTLYRIKALTSFKTIDGKMVRRGDIGGWIESEDSLSQEGLCWVADDAMVIGQARVYDNALVCDNAQVFGGATVYEDAIICDRAWVFDQASVYGHTRVYGNSQVFLPRQMENLESIIKQS